MDNINLITDLNKFVEIKKKIPNDICYIYGKNTPFFNSFLDLSLINNLKLNNEEIPKLYLYIIKNINYLLKNSFKQKILYFFYYLIFPFKNLYHKKILKNKIKKLRNFINKFNLENDFSTDIEFNEKFIPIYLSFYNKNKYKEWNYFIFFDSYYNKNFFINSIKIELQNRFKNKNDSKFINILNYLIEINYLCKILSYQNIDYSYYYLYVKQIIDKLNFISTFYYNYEFILVIQIIDHDYRYIIKNYLIKNYDFKEFIKINKKYKNKLYYDLIFSVFLKYNKDHNSNVLKNSKDSFDENDDNNDDNYKNSIIDLIIKKKNNNMIFKIKKSKKFKIFIFKIYSKIYSILYYPIKINITKFYFLIFKIILLIFILLHGILEFYMLLFNLYFKNYYILFINWVYPGFLCYWLILILFIVYFILINYKILNIINHLLVYSLFIYFIDIFVSLITKTYIEYYNYFFVLVLRILILFFVKMFKNYHIQYNINYIKKRENVVYNYN